MKITEKQMQFLKRMSDGVDNLRRLGLYGENLRWETPSGFHELANVATFNGLKAKKLVVERRVNVSGTMMMVSVFELTDAGKAAIASAQEN